MKRLMIVGGIAIVLVAVLLINGPTLAETVTYGGDELIPLATPWYRHWWVWTIGAVWLIAIAAFIRLETIEPKQRGSSFDEDL